MNRKTLNIAAIALMIVLSVSLALAGFFTTNAVARASDTTTVTAAIPEPTTMGLILIGAVCELIRQRRRNKNK